MKEFSQTFEDGVVVTSAGGEVALTSSVGAGEPEMSIYKYSSGVAFPSPNGETVIEHVGLVTNKQEDWSWATVVLKPEGFCARHHHNDRDEIYYITKGDLVVEVDGDVKTYCAGEKIVIPRGSIHQVTNLSKDTAYMMVLCEPSWLYTDSHEDADLLEHGASRVALDSAPAAKPAEAESVEKHAEPSVGASVVEAEASIFAQPKKGSEKVSSESVTPSASS